MIQDSINHDPAAQTRRLPGVSAEVRSNRMPSPAGSEFKDILSAFQIREIKNTFKTKGLTITDYRARPVISKSRCRTKIEPAASEWKSTFRDQFLKHQASPAIQKDTLKTALPWPDEMKAADSAKTPGVKACSQEAGLTEQQIIERNVRIAAEKYDLPSQLISAVIRAESNFQVRAVSPAGAQGLMQLMPTTANELGVKNPFDIEQNIDGGARYLRKMLDLFGGSLKKALAAYNAGPGAVSKYGGRVPYPETRQYVQRVLRFSRQTA